MANVIINDTNLTNIADAIRAKNGSTDTYKPSEMAAAITAISGGGPDIPESAFAFSGDCKYLNYNGHWDWFFDNYGNQITVNPNEITSWMYLSKIKNWKPKSNIRANGFFNDMRNLEIISGEITAENVGTRNLVGSLFNNCYNLRLFPENTYIVFENNKGTNMVNAFNNCMSLREIPQNVISHLTGTVCNTMFAGATTLSEIENFPIHSKYDYNSFPNMIKDTGRLSKFTFVTDNGTPYVAEWKTHILDFSVRTGWNYSNADVLNYNSGITADKQVTDDTTYQALKDDVDWFTTDVNYSRYNHDSAVATINSLPDTSAYLASAGGTNTIKFKGAAGASTDGGAINTLTEEEIAVATAKGWTVSLV